MSTQWYEGMEEMPPVGNSDVVNWDWDLNPYTGEYQWRLKGPHGFYNGADAIRIFDDMVKHHPNHPGTMTWLRAWVRYMEMLL